MFPRSYRRAIILFALFCQVVTASFAPMTVASAATPAAPVAGHCHDHPQATAGGTASSAMASSMGKHDFTSTAPDPSQHHCKNGVCHCACAHAAAALPLLPAADTVQLSHPPVTSRYQAPNAPHPTTSFFRPPI